MNEKALSEIRTYFWCQSILDALELKSISEFKKLPDLPYSPFKKNYSHLFSNKDTITRAFEVFCSDPFDSKTWDGYFKGTSPTKKTKANHSSYDIIGELLPQTKKAYNKGAFNIISVFTSSYIKDAINDFANGVIELYRSENLEIEVFQPNLDTSKPEIFHNYREVFESNLQRGHFKFCFDCYTAILNKNSENLGQNVSILKLMEAYIKLNFFGESPQVFARLLVEGEAVQLMKERYNIQPFLWKKAFHAIDDVLSHYAEFREEWCWIEEQEKFIEE